MEAKEKLDVNDVFAIEETLINAHEALRKQIFKAKWNTARSQVAPNGANFSDCMGTLQVNIEVLKTFIKELEELL